MMPPVLPHDIINPGERGMRPHKGDEEPVVFPGGEEVSRGPLVLELEHHVSLTLQPGCSLSLERADPPETGGRSHDDAPASGTCWLSMISATWQETSSPSATVRNRSLGMR